MQRSFCSFIKNGKERKDRSVLLKRMDAQPCSQGLPLAAPLLLQLLLQNLGRTILCSAIPARAQTRNLTIATSQPTTAPARQD